MNLRGFNHTLTAKLMLGILLPTVLIVSFSLVYIILTSKKEAIADAEQTVNASTRESALLVKDRIDGELATLRAIAMAFQRYPESNRQDQMEFFDPVLNDILLANPHALSVWVNWELNILDPSYDKENGRRRITYYKSNGTSNKIMETLEEDGVASGGVYYDLKKNPRDLITEPYYFRYEDADTNRYLEASICVPMFINHDFAGVVGMDIKLEQLYGLISDIVPFEGSRTLILSREGTIMASPDVLFENRSAADYPIIKSAAISLIDSMASGKPFGFFSSYHSTRDFYVNIVPFHIGNDEEHWYIALLVPTKTIWGQVFERGRELTFLGAFGIIFLSLFVWLIARRITKPLTHISSEIDTLSRGNAAGVNEIPVTAHDELGQLAHALNNLTRNLRDSARFADDIGKGDYDSPFEPLSEDDTMGNALLKMRSSLSELRKETLDNTWQNESALTIGELLQRERIASDLGNQLLSELATILNIQMGALYWEDDDHFVLISTYAYSSGDNPKRFKLGEGLIGQAALDQKGIEIYDVPSDYFAVTSGLGSHLPEHLLIIPLVYHKKTIAVMEMASMKKLPKRSITFLEKISENLAIALQSIKINNEVRILLQKTQEQAEELKAQHEKLLDTNHTLEQKTKALRVSEEELIQQQEELRVTNEELTTKTHSLEAQKTQISEKNLALENASQELERKAIALEAASRLKSEFLANMSHELRTPLNSILILSDNLAENNEQNLDDQQVESARIINKSGHDLLTLINDILDLSKIEAGKMQLTPETISIRTLARDMEGSFTPITRRKGIELITEINKGADISIITDEKRLAQILKNFLSNAIKFTSEGTITMRYFRPEEGTNYFRPELQNKDIIAIAVSDTGMGIPYEKQQEIFEAFTQADGSISRQYGGTGLGLSISKELATILDGEIHLESEPGKGSTFTLFLPTEISMNDPDSGEGITDSDSVLETAERSVLPIHEGNLHHVHFIDDDFEHWSENDLTIVVIEDDEDFARILCGQCHENGFKCIACQTGEHGYEMVVSTTPSAVLLDINLPGMNGWKVLDMIKESPAIRHIPVHIVSSSEDHISSSQKGAIGFLSKPVTKEGLNNTFTRIRSIIENKTGKLLLVEDDPAMRRSLKILVEDKDISISEAGSGSEALEKLQEDQYDCMILDLGLSDMTGFELIDKLNESLSEIPPIIIYTGRDLTKEENKQLEKYADSIIIKGVKSEERLLDETALFMHRVVAEMPKKKQQMIAAIHQPNNQLTGKRILLIDDDMRNIFALTKVLSDQGMIVERAENGLEALSILEKDSTFDLLLIDIMMPLMDGYETIGHIRKMPSLAKTPIIALTAKAMKEDRQKCIDVGANDYMAKPLNIEKLLSLLRVWLYQ